MTRSTSLDDLVASAKAHADEAEIADALEKALREIQSGKSNLDATWESAVEEFITWKAGKKSANTARYYKTQLTVLVRWCEERDITLHTFRESHLDEYLVWRKTEGGRGGKPVSPGTLFHDQITTRAFFKICSKRGLIKRNPLAGLTVDQPPKVSIPVPTQGELTTLLTAIRERYDPRKNDGMRFMTLPQRRFYEARDYCIVAGLVDTGVREGELFALTIHDIDMDAREIHIRQSKTGQPRTVPISAEWAILLQAWLKVRSKADTDTNLLFFGHAGDALTTSYYARHFKKFVTFAGTKKFTPHALRHATATKIAKRSTLAAKDILGHESLQTTQIYAQSDRDHNREVHEAAAPLASILGKPSVGRPRKPRIV